MPVSRVPELLRSPVAASTEDVQLTIAFTFLSNTASIEITGLPSVDPIVIRDTGVLKL